MSDDWGTEDWPTTKAEVSNDNDDWGSSGVTSGQSNSKSYETNDATKGFGRGIGRAKRMSDWRETNEKQNDWNDWAQDKPRGDSRNFEDNSYSSQAKRRIQILATSVGKVIGRGGQTIRDLESRSGAKINIIKDSGGSYETEVQLSGTNEQIDSAQKLINDLISTDSRNSYQSSQTYRNNSNQNYDFNQNSAKTESNPSTDEFIDWGAAIKESEEATRQKWASLPPINKQFYFEDSEIRAMTPDLVDKFRLENNKIMVSHFKEGDTRVIPNPVTKFEHAFKHYPEIMAEIMKQGFTTPSPIQCQSWPILLSGFDLIGIAQTGTGKTLAYLLPALIHIDSQPTKREDRPGPTALIMAPTRELAQQIEKECNKYSYRGIKCICIYGGGDRRSQIDKVGRGVEIVIATPGRLNDLCMNRIIDLSSVSYLVLDEADRMLDMGFEPQIKKIMLDIRPERHTVMMSATWPECVRRLATTYMSDPMQIYVGSYDLAAVHSVKQDIVMTSAEDKRKLLYEFFSRMQPHHKVIVFVGKKAVADDVASDCVLRGIDCQSIHGDRDQHDREQALEDIRSGSVKILIATDVASRGLDIDDISHIFNYDFPRNIEEYVHRVGRTGRAGRTGEALTLMTREDWRHAQELIDILQEANQVVPQDLFAMAERYKAFRIKVDAENAAAERSGCPRPRGGRGGRGRRW